MKRNFKLQIIDQQDIDRILECALLLLEKVGVKYLEQKSLDALKSAGADISFENQTARFPRDLVRETLKNVPERFDWYYKSFEKKLEVGGDNIYFGITTYDHYILDYDSMERRLATLEDVRRFLILDDSLDNIDYQGAEVVPHDVPTELMQIKAAEMLLNYGRKALLFSMLNKSDAKYILRMAEIIAGSKENVGKRPFMIVPICPSSPFTYQKDVIDIVFAACDYGLPIMVGPCPVCGVSSPITLAGTVSQILAEQLGGILLIKAIRPDLPISVGSTPFMMNFREGNLIAGAPERLLVEAILAQIHRYLRIPCQGSGTMTDAKVPTIQMGYEKGIGLLLLTLSGMSIVNACPILDEGKTTAFEQHLIEADAVDMVIRILRGISISDETLALNIIEKADHEAEFLKYEHTRKFFRSEHWLPRVMFRGSWETFDKSRETIIQTARRRMTQIWKEREPQGLPEDKARELAAIAAEAEKELLTKT